MEVFAMEKLKKCIPPLNKVVQAGNVDHYG